ncbi:uncharacterized protein [Euwallacea fornicatus]|uniref:uncharacterized protein n=1 Tax=Euwallacea fornicatus TaxID=995702 RepID=UPI00338D516B
MTSEKVNRVVTSNWEDKTVVALKLECGVNMFLEAIPKKHPRGHAPQNAQRQVRPKNTPEPLENQASDLKQKPTSKVEVNMSGPEDRYSGLGILRQKETRVAIKRLRKNI